MSTTNSIKSPEHYLALIRARVQKTQSAAQHPRHDTAMAYNELASGYDNSCHENGGSNVDITRFPPGEVATARPAPRHSDSDHALPEARRPQPEILGLPGLLRDPPVARHSCESAPEDHSVDASASELGPVGAEAEHDRCPRPARLPAAEEISLLKLQIFDAGRTGRGRPRFTAKIEAHMEEVARIRLRNPAVTVYADLLTPEAFGRSVERGLRSGSLSESDAEGAHDAAHRLMEEWRNPNWPPHGLGFVGVKRRGAGTERAHDQMVLLVWEPAPQDGKHELPYRPRLIVSLPDDAFAADRVVELTDNLSNERAAHWAAYYDPHGYNEHRKQAPPAQSASRGLQAAVRRRLTVGRA